MQAGRGGLNESSRRTVERVVISSLSHSACLYTSRADRASSTEATTNSLQHHFLAFTRWRREAVVS